MRTTLILVVVFAVFAAGYLFAYSRVLAPPGILQAFAQEPEFVEEEGVVEDCLPEENTEIVVEEPQPEQFVEAEVPVAENRQPAFVRFDWAFPDDAINPVFDIQQNTRDILSVMWGEVNENGEVTIRQGSDYGDHFHYDGDVSHANPSLWKSSLASGGVNAEIARAGAERVFLNVSVANVKWMRALTATPQSRAAAINKMVDFVALEGFHGVDIDFEDYGAWSHEDKDYYLLFLTQLKAQLDVRGYELAVEVPPIWNTTTGAHSESGQGNEWDSSNSQSYYTLTYADIDRIAPGYVVVMAYDYHFDYSVGRPSQPLEWLEDTVSFAKSKMPGTRILAGIPAAGYSGKTGTYAGKPGTFESLSKQPGFQQALQAPDEESGEILWEHDGKSYAVSSDYSVGVKIDVAKSLGVAGYALWHLGENRYGM